MIVFEKAVELSIDCSRKCSGLDDEQESLSVTQVYKLIEGLVDRVVVRKFFFQELIDVRCLFLRVDMIYMFVFSVDKIVFV